LTHKFPPDLYPPLKKLGALKKLKALGPFLEAVGTFDGLL
jgi:hypothetical protein